MADKLHGGCLCGAVRYGCGAEPVLTGLCHCRHCQKQTSAWLQPIMEIWCETAQPWVAADPARQRLARNPPLGAG